MRSPSEIEDRIWLRSRDVSDAPAIGGEEYFERHEVPRAEDLTAADLPPAEYEAVREIDREALDRGKVIGKWQVTGSAERIDDLWSTLVGDAEDGALWAAKAMTATGYEELPYDERVIAVYTPNYFDREDVWRVREHLREERDVTRELFYKPDVYTAKGIVAATAAEFGLERPARYVG